MSNAQARIPEHRMYGYNVVIFRSFEARPVFHSHGRGHRDDFDDSWTARTGCGKVHYRSHAGQSETVGILLDPRHAIRFARPCRRCYRHGAPEPIPELSDNGNG